MMTREQASRIALEQTAEVKRTLGAIQQVLLESTRTSVLITSASIDEGKTLCASSLAAAAASVGESRVLAMDFNWHRPAMHRFFEEPTQHTTSKIREADLPELVSHQSGPSLDVLFAPSDYTDGAGRDADDSSVAQRLIAQAKDSYDLVIIDSSAIFPTNRTMIDPVMLCREVDGAVMVVARGLSRKPLVKRAQKTLEITGANVIGVVTNQPHTS